MRLLYPSVLVEEGLEILHIKIQQDTELQNKTDLTKDEIFKLAKLCTENPYFECELGFFKQKGGTPMGGPLSRCLADLIIENKIEKTDFRTPTLGTKMGLGEIDWRYSISLGTKRDIPRLL